jgi:hypothetical protein
MKFWRGKVRLHCLQVTGRIIQRGESGPKSRASCLKLLQVDLDQELMAVKCIHSMNILFIVTLCMNYVDELWMSCALYRQVYREVLQP